MFISVMQLLLVGGNQIGFDQNLDLSSQTQAWDYHSICFCTRWFWQGQRCRMVVAAAAVMVMRVAIVTDGSDKVEASVEVTTKISLSTDHVIGK
ncbi:hypothetical protein CMV_024082 [Castanea mollissima]|uniref:Uncharacterized protein n=1 Tax=Castanea mollissima TaxID=60419 RepID=A0A8J4QHP1_9ROSI|nr:hypothetical protein CMV_024082 [Castanea mollissima]